jgi:hypothetical protein
VHSLFTNPTPYLDQSPEEKQQTAGHAFEAAGSAALGGFAAPRPANALAANSARISRRSSGLSEADLLEASGISPRMRRAVEVYRQMKGDWDHGAVMYPEIADELWALGRGDWKGNAGRPMVHPGAIDNTAARSKGTGPRSAEGPSLSQNLSSDPDTTFHYQLFMDGNPVGIAKGSIIDGSAKFDWLGHEVGGANTLGVPGVRALREAFREDYPDVKKFTGWRVSGARGGADHKTAQQEVYMPANANALASMFMPFLQSEQPRNALSGYYYGQDRR